MQSTMEIKVRGFHLDRAGQVSNTRYLDFVEEAGWLYAERNHLFANIHHLGVDHATTNITINYLHRAGAGDLLRIDTDVARRGQRAISFQHKIFNDGTGRLVADAQVTVVFLERATGRVVPIDERITELWPELQELPAE